MLPLKSYNNIFEGNALCINWHEVVNADELNFIIGNPPFVGQSVRTKKQSDDMAFIWGKGEIETKLDYVICWYKKAMDYMKGTAVKVAFCIDEFNMSGRIRADILEEDDREWSGNQLWV